MPALLPRRERRGPTKDEPSGASRTRSLPVRRSALVRTAVWVAVAAGPLALVASCARPDAVVRTRPAPVTQADTAKEPVTDPGGYAELVLDVWLRAGHDEEGAAARQLRVMAPSVPPPSWGEHAPVAERLTVVRSVRQGTGAWSITVAARFKASAGRSGGEGGAAAEGAGGLRYFAVPLVVKEQDVAPGAARGFVVPAAPMEVSAPRTLEEPDSPFGTEVPAESDLAVTVGEFLSAYLGTAEGADRYVAPGVSLPALRGSAPFEEVRLEEVRAQEQTDGQPGADGTTARVLVEITASDPGGGQWPMSYALKLKARDGRWEVTALQSGLENAAGKSEQRSKPAGSVSTADARPSPAPGEPTVTVNAVAQEVQR
ncbi:conjugal transfer protein [Streptomyces aureoverticillatus]|uniref:conjugal transfer protein n=1 Tax=Streptomyces aureoverticillatus TaxID=66871 RepID=UPI0013DADF42|nr:conjugal transfer protein [Streptomyces aureoverticillatus]QIB49528.1 conjugal transfer protein [Streptomyces aureoverticillatus]